MGTEDSKESELDVGRVGSGVGQTALQVGAERDHLEGILHVKPEINQRLFAFA